MAVLSGSEKITINELNERMKAGEIAVFTEKDIARYSEDLKKSYYDDEITSEQYTEALKERHRMTKSIVTNIDNVNLFTVFIHKIKKR